MQDKIERYDLLISYIWEFDFDFLKLTEKIFQNNGFRTFVVNNSNLHEVSEAIKNNELIFKAYLDRASDEEHKFTELIPLLKSHNSYIINEIEKVEKVIDKSITHYRLADAGLNLPTTFILPTFDSVPNLTINDENLDQIGKPFVIKPAYYTGGGEGVICDASSISDIIDERTKFPDDKYLVQKKIYPKMLNGKRAWFRMINAFGKILPVWWDDLTHIYFPLTSDEINKYELDELIHVFDIVSEIADLDYFSTEIALAEDGNFYVIDYINDMCDLRLKSKHHDGVPDEIVENFILSMLNKIRLL